MVNIKYDNKTIVIPKPFNECDFGKKRKLKKNDKKGWIK